MAKFQVLKNKKVLKEFDNAMDTALFATIMSMVLIWTSIQMISKRQKLGLILNTKKVYNG